MPMKLISKDKKKGTLTFLWKKTTPAFANTIRRLIIEEVPTMAVEDVEFRKNSSALYDEVIAHRLGLIPLTSDVKSYNLLEKCKCEGEGCAKCRLKMTLNAKSAGMVFASRIKSQDPKVVPAFENTPIVKLNEEQQIQLEATAVLGKGKTHAKFSPGLVFYKYAPKIGILKKVANPEKAAESCPVNVYEVKNSELVIIKDKINDCHLCNACVDASDNAISITQDEGSLIFSIESFGQLDPKDMLISAADIFDEKLEELSELLKK